MDFGIFDALTLVGSLGFFIYGMKIMSEGIQKVAGARMRQILSIMTSNRFSGALTGFLLTSLVQSSSATTVMVVSFVNAGLLSLVQAIGVIMGANIGTTITAWIISILGLKVKIAAAALPIIAFGFPLLFSSRNKIRSWGEVIVGFALLFMGLEALKSSVPDIKSNPQMLEFLASYTDLGIISTLIFVGIGTVLTIVVQSSSATMAITILMANQGWISFDIAASMVLGENIGTTITANLAALVANTYAKRAALAHFIFNIFGVTWMMILFPVFLGAIDNYMTDAYNNSPYQSAEAIPIGLSIFHTTFNIINTVALIGFVKFIASVVTKMVPIKGEENEFRLEYISDRLMKTPEVSLQEAAKEVAKFGKITSRMSGFIQVLIEKKKLKKRSA
ncbi:MAG: Na/Pi cotransporter family protein, partial [Cytophagales bacterium]|nr:Na/Pi cotransporter family protein [Cytophagales bacterium]